MIDQVQELSERSVRHLYIAAKEDNHIDWGLQGERNMIGLSETMNEL